MSLSKFDTMYTRYNIDRDEFEQVSEPDPSLNYTYADYLTWDFEERLELIRGKIFKMSPAPSPRHQEVSSTLNGLLYNYLKQRRCKVYPAPFDVRLPVRNKKIDNEITTVVQPDLSIVCDESKIDDRGCCGAPDLVIEILSPGNTKKELRIKYELYEEAGVKEYWVVYPVEESIAVFILNNEGEFDGAKIYASGDKLESKAIGGFIILLNDVFIK